MNEEVQGGGVDLNERPEVNEFEPPTTSVRPQDTIASFETSRGSVYTYNEEGRTTRYKAATGEGYETQGITVFANLNLKMKKDVLLALLRSIGPKTKIYVSEKQPDGQQRIVSDVGDVKDPASLFLTIYQGDNIAEVTPATLFSQEGFMVFDSRQFMEDGVMRTERHLGHPITKINYRT
ncbi:MAG TPA: hypothetical protein VGF75_03200 [Candidatus Saccharimonadales bacterium]|jgi:hypothetical protein